jgi:NADH dehydrogenase (ubiquinone) Fe-S protein 3
MQIKINNQLKTILPLISYNLVDNILIVSNQQLFFSLNCLKSHVGYQFNLLSCISGVDFLGKKYRFGVVYDLLSITFNRRLRLKVFVNEVTPLQSIVNLFINANWWEREIWDLYGIYFDKHPDLRRILTDYGFESHPMRKDFPCSGFVELRYNENKKKIVVKPIHLAQEFRMFNFQTPW